MKSLLLAFAVALTGCQPVLEAAFVPAAKSSNRVPAAPHAVLPVNARLPTPSAPFAAAGGESVTLQQFAGQVVVLHLWATWCAPCLREMPLLDRLAADMQSVRVVPVSVDIRPEQAVTFLQQQLFQHLGAYHDPDGQLMRDLGAHALPMSFLMDRQGRIAAVFKGSVDWNSASIRTLLSGI